LRVPLGEGNREARNGQEPGKVSQSDQKIDELVQAAAELYPSHHKGISCAELLDAKELTAA
jgi:hypothetical protein